MLSTLYPDNVDDAVIDFALSSNRDWNSINGAETSEI